MHRELDLFTANRDFPATLRELATRGEQRRFRKGTILIHEGDLGDSLFILLGGRVKVYCMDEHAREITFGIFGAGEYVGEMALDGGPRSASVITLEPTVCAVVRRPEILAYIAHCPEFSFEMLSKMIRRLRLATRDARNLAFIDVYGRVTRLLNELAQPLPDGRRRIAERVTHQDIASRAGCSREMVSRILKDLTVGSYLVVEDHHIVLTAKLPQRW